MEWRPARTKTTGAAPAHLDTAPLAAHAGQHVGGAARLPADLAARAGGQVALPPMVVVRTLRRGSSATRRDLGPAPPRSGVRALCTYVVPVPVPVALAAVAAGEGHTVGVNVQLTHCGTDNWELSPLSRPPPPSCRPCFPSPSCA